MSLAEIASRLEDLIGLDPEIVGVDVVDHAVRRRMEALSLSEIGEYSALLAGSERETQELVEHVVVAETWFHRDREPFVFLGRYAALEWLPARRGQTFRVLSAPCSTGEEAYSIAMSLLDAGLTAEQFQIDAVDVSDAALAKAAQGVYGRNSFRGVNLVFRERYFDRKGERFQVCEEVSRTVRFCRGNLLDEMLLREAQPYQAVFCRNLMIYLARNARSRVLACLDRLLDRPGLLFVGHAETLLVTSGPFIEAGHPRAFAFRTREPSEPGSPPAGLVVGSPRSGPASPACPSPPGKQAPGILRIGRFHGQAPPHTGAGLEDALREADGGNLAGAEKLCERCLAESGPSAQAYFILGLVREASGYMDAAEKDFGRAIYLEPGHYQALVHLALLIRRRDAAAAALLEQRANRVKFLNAI